MEYRNAPQENFMCRSCAHVQIIEYILMAWSCMVWYWSEYINILLDLLMHIYYTDGIIHLKGI